MLRRAIRSAVVFLALAACGLAQGKPPAPKPPSQPSASPQPGQANSEYIIWGHLALPDDSPSAGIEVVLRTAEHYEFESAYADREGLFQFRLPNSGTYYLFVNLDGFAPVEQQVVLQPSGFNSSANVMIRLIQGVADTGQPQTHRAADDDKKTSAGAGVIDASLFKKYPEKARKEYQEGLDEQSRGNQEKAAAHFEKAVAAAPQFVEAYVQLGGVDLDRAGKLAAGGKTPEAAAAYGDAVTQLQKAIAIDKSSLQALYYLGSAQFKLGDLKAAETSLSAALNGPKPYQDARLMYVNVLMKERRYKEALDQLIAYLEARPDSPQRKAIEQMEAQIRAVLNR